MASGSERKWWSKDTLAVVTGGNKGIGYQVVKQLAEQGISVVLTSRNKALGSDAAEALSSTGLNVTFHVLDVASEESIRTFVDWLKQEHGGLDILVNNAGTFTRVDAIQDVEAVMGVNYWGPVLLARELVPLFKSTPNGGRIVNVTSAYARLEYLQNKAWKERLSGSDLDQETLDNYVAEYLEAVRAGTSQGWSNSYEASKLALNVFTRVFSKDPAVHTDDRIIYVNSVHPGYVKTDMSPNGNISPAEGADTVVWAALLPAGGPTGGFYYLRKEYGF
eukprot:TRINITY_DN4316_c0_g1_i3.p1 TRINITY_DN4316_c0_g1~~TRINITY_DN4316_c0_g1_i3.p1  ORF type:complete len:277 (+),score=44.99 TRINITY_DN4316_c0_g1_i3:181-1011(+)